MPIFVTPPESSVRFYGARLFAFLQLGIRGKNLYWLNNGTYTTNQPSEMDTVRRTFLGGHDNYVTDSEAAALIAAGYSVLPGTFELDSVYSSSLDSSATLGN
jgi:hypothetical protein